MDTELIKKIEKAFSFAYGIGFAPSEDYRLSPPVIWLIYKEADFNKSGIIPVYKELVHNAKDLLTIELYRANGKLVFALTNDDVLIKSPLLLYNEEQLSDFDRGTSNLWGIALGLSVDGSVIPPVTEGIMVCNGFSIDSQ